MACPTTYLTGSAGDALAACAAIGSGIDRVLAPGWRSAGGEGCGSARSSRRHTPSTLVRSEDSRLRTAVWAPGVLVVTIAIRDDPMVIVQDADLTARRLSAADWPWVQQWFHDPVLNTRLGPVDQEWLQEVLTAGDSVQLVIHTPAGHPVALLGCTWDPTGDLHAFTDVAVDPLLRGNGYRRRALSVAMAYPDHPPARSWLTFVDPHNQAAFAFFTRCGWQHEGLDNGMHRFVHPSRDYGQLCNG